jgi:hypothetical protein
MSQPKNHRASNLTPKAAHYLELLLLEYNLRKCILFKDDSMIRLLQPGKCFSPFPSYPRRRKESCFFQGDSHQIQQSRFRAPTRIRRAPGSRPAMAGRFPTSATDRGASSNQMRRRSGSETKRGEEGRGNKESEAGKAQEADKNWRSASATEPCAEAGTEEKRAGISLI